MTVERYRESVQLRLRLRLRLRRLLGQPALWFIAMRTDFGVSFGGYKQSGIGREGVREGLPHFSGDQVRDLGRPARRLREHGTLAADRRTGGRPAGRGPCTARLAGCRGRANEALLVDGGCRSIATTIYVEVVVPATHMTRPREGE